MDVDNFKEISNIYGLSTANKLFLELSEDLRFSLRAIDVMGIFGIDELIIYLPNTTLENAKTVIQRFRTKIKEKKFTSKSVSTSLSIGLVTFHHGESIQSFTWRAQTALYQAKVLRRGYLKVIP